MLLHAGGRTLEDLRELAREDALLTLLGHEALPDPDTVGDWLRIIDLGPEGGDERGQVVAAGRPEEVAADPTSYTGQFLKKLLSR